MLGSAWASKIHALGTLSPGSNLPCNCVLSDLWQVAWPRLLMNTEVARRINEVGRAKRCERLPLRGFKKPPLAVGECLEQPLSRQSPDMSGLFS